MANNGEIVIRIEEGSVQPRPVDPDNQEKKDSASMTETAALTFCLKRAAEAVKSITIDEVKYQLNKHFELTDDYISQQNMNIALNVVNKVKNTAMSMIGGYAVAGPAGAAVMGMISIVNTSIQISRNYEQERIRLNKMDAELKFNRERAGYSLTAGSIGENR